MEPELRHVRSFLAVAHELNFTRAAARLHVAQPALSKRISQLERHVGAPLFERTTRDVRLTAAGEVLRSAVAPALVALDAALGAAVDAAGAGQSVVLAHSASCGYETVPMVMAALRTAFPQVAVDARMLATDAVPGLVAAGEADVGLLQAYGGEGPVPGGVHVELLRREPQGVLMARTHALADRAVVRVADLAGQAVRVPARSLAPARYDSTVALLASRGVEARLVVDEVRFDPAMTRIRSGELIGITARSAAIGSDVHWARLTDAPRVSTDLLVRDQESRPGVRHLVEVARGCRERHRWLSGSGSPRRIGAGGGE